MTWAKEKSVVVRVKKAKSIEDVLEEVDVLIATHFFTEFSGTKSSEFLKKVIMHQSAIDMNLFKRTWRTLNCSPKTMKVIREIQENLLCVGKRKELITKQRTETLCWCSKTRLPLNAKHTIRCCMRMSGEIITRHGIVLNVLLNNILIQRGLISNEQKWEDRKTVRSARDEITVGIEHWVSDEWKEKAGSLERS